MKIFVTGVNGQLGYAAALELLQRGHQVILSGSKPVYTGKPGPLNQLPYEVLDITNEEKVEEVLTWVHPEVLLHCAAWTAVDAAEEPENQEKVWAVNARATEYLAKTCAQIGAKMVYISTDYVFDGQGTVPWQPDDQNYHPLNVYGASKLAGEQAVRANLDRFYIVRIAWVFGPNGNNFVKTMLKLRKTHSQLRVVCDQVGTPTYTPDVARVLAELLESENYGYYHVTNSGGYISWYDFACEIFRQAGYGVSVLPVTTAEYGISKAQRPFNSRLDTSKLSACGIEPMPTWQDALSRYIALWKNEEKE